MKLVDSPPRKVGEKYMHKSNSDDLLRISRKRLFVSKEEAKIQNNLEMFTFPERLMTEIAFLHKNYAENDKELKIRNPLIQINFSIEEKITNKKYSHEELLSFLDLIQEQIIMSHKELKKSKELKKKKYPKSISQKEYKYKLVKTFISQGLSISTIAKIMKKSEGQISYIKKY
jgi:hypothetical protein